MVSMAKQVKEEGGLDRLSSLPDHILDHILSFLPTKETVSTSILSTRWRYLFASSISILDFNECLQFVNDGAKDNFRSFVDRLLFESKLFNLEIFRLCDLSQFDDPIRLYHWIAATICRGVKEIDICSASQIMLPITLFTCLSLTTLKLTGGGEIKFPTNACLPNLKTLHLDALVCSDGSILSLVSSCLALDDLAFVDCVFRKISVLSIHNLSLKRLVLDFEDKKFSLSWNFYYTVEINAPCLVYFRYAGLLAEASSFSNMNSLETADVRIFNCPDSTVYNVDRRPCATHLLQAICNVQSLVLYIEEADTIFPRRSKPLLSFHNLVELNVLNYRGSWQETWLVEFLHTMPNLETLLLSRYIRGGLTLRSWSAPEAAPCCFLHLKKVEVQEYEGDSATFNMMSYFLNHALLLKTFLIRTNPWQGDRSRSTIIKKLQSLQKYSKECEVKIY